MLKLSELVHCLIREENSPGDYYLFLGKISLAEEKELRQQINQTGRKDLQLEGDYILRIRPYWESESNLWVPEMGL